MAATMPFGTHLPPGNYALPGSRPRPDRLGFVPQYAKVSAMKDNPVLHGIGHLRVVTPHNGFSLRQVNNR
jgi:hypothetical protein